MRKSYRSGNSVGKDDSIQSTIAECTVAVIDDAVIFPELKKCDICGFRCVVQSSFSINVKLVSFYTINRCFFVAILIQPLQRHAKLRKLFYSKAQLRPWTVFCWLFTLITNQFKVLRNILPAMYLSFAIWGVNRHCRPEVTSPYNFYALSFILELDTCFVSIVSRSWANGALWSSTARRRIKLEVTLPFDDATIYICRLSARLSTLQAFCHCRLWRNVNFGW